MKPSSLIRLTTLLLMMFITTNCEKEGITTSTFNDTRDGHIYKSVTIGRQTWMAENLAYIPRIGPENEQIGIWVYGYNGRDTAEAILTDNYKIYGCLYDWRVATDCGSTGRGRGICPGGWHMPTDEEWMELEKTLGMKSSELKDDFFRESGLVGKQLKSTETWNPSHADDNNSQFSATAGGYRRNDGFCDMIGYLGNFWTSTRLPDGSVAINRFLAPSNNGVYRGNNWIDAGLSVRCVKDE